jgi:hypothetical protein
MERKHRKRKQLAKSERFHGSYDHSTVLEQTKIFTTFGARKSRTVDS